MKGFLALTIDEAIFDKQNKTVPEAIPRIPTVNKVERKQYFYILLNLVGYSVDNNNYAHVTHDIKIIKPDGTIYFEQKDLPAVEGQFDENYPLPIALSETPIKMCFEPEDDYGTYNIITKIYDKIDGIEETIEEKIELIKFENIDYFKGSDEKFNEWMYSYHVEPSPEKSISAYLDWAPKIKNQKETAFPPIFSFFLEIFRNNEHLIPHLLDIFDTQEEELRFYILYILIHLNNDLDEFFASLSDMNLKMYQEILKTRGEFDPISEVRSGEHLDMLWGTFFGGGKYEPVKKIIEVLELSPYFGYDEEFQKIKKPSDEEKKKFYLAIIFKAAFWSLSSNASQHELVHDYCRHYYYYSDGLSPNIERGLRNALIASSKKWYEKAVVQGKAGNEIKAINYFLKVVNLPEKNPNYQHAISTAGALFFKTGQDIQGFYYSKKALEIDSNDGQTLMNLANKYGQLKEFEKAKEILERLTKLYPKNINAWLTLGHINVDLNDAKQAIQCYKKVLKLDSKNEIAKEKLKILKEN